MSDIKNNPKLQAEIEQQLRLASGGQSIKVPPDTERIIVTEKNNTITATVIDKENKMSTISTEYIDTDASSVPPLWDEHRALDKAKDDALNNKNTGINNANSKVLDPTYAVKQGGLSYNNKPLENNPKSNKPAISADTQAHQQEEAREKALAEARKILATSLVNDVQYDAQTNLKNDLSDRRISLNIVPKGTALDTNSDKIAQVLGKEVQNDFYGLLYNTLQESNGIIFPYTPSISVKGSAEYETIQIPRSNFAYNYYKNTKPIEYDIQKITLTCENDEMALQMLVIMWFCMCCTKCEFGEKVSTPDKNYAGLPPPILYLNGYNSLIDNVPVVISSFSYTLPEDVDYICLDIDLSNKHLTRSRSLNNNKPFSPIKEDSVLKFWLPTELSLTIKLLTQPNPIKTKKVFNLNDLKMGVLNTKNYRNNSTVTFALPGSSYGVGSGGNTDSNDNSGLNQIYTFNNSGWTW